MCVAGLRIRERSSILWLVVGPCSLRKLSRTSRDKCLRLGGLSLTWILPNKIPQESAGYTVTRRVWPANKIKLFMFVMCHWLDRAFPKSHTNRSMNHQLAGSKPAVMRVALGCWRVRCQFPNKRANGHYSSGQWQNPHTESLRSSCWCLFYERAHSHRKLLLFYSNIHFYSVSPEHSSITLVYRTNDNVFGVYPVRLFRIIVRLVSKSHRTYLRRSVFFLILDGHSNWPYLMPIKQHWPSMRDPFKKLKFSAQAVILF